MMLQSTPKRLRSAENFTEEGFVASEDAGLEVKPGCSPNRRPRNDLQPSQKNHVNAYTDSHQRTPGRNDVNLSIRNVYNFLSRETSPYIQNKKHSQLRIEIIGKSVSGKGFLPTPVEVALKAARRYRHPERSSSNMPHIIIPRSEASRRHSVEVLDKIRTNSNSENDHDIQIGENGESTNRDERSKQTGIEKALRKTSVTWGSRVRCYKIYKERSFQMNKVKSGNFSLATPNEGNLSLNNTETDQNARVSPNMGNRSPAGLYHRTAGSAAPQINSNIDNPPTSNSKAFTTPPATYKKDNPQCAISRTGDRSKIISTSGCTPSVVTKSHNPAFSRSLSNNDVGLIAGNSDISMRNSTSTLTFRHFPANEKNISKKVKDRKVTQIANPSHLSNGCPLTRANTDSILTVHLPGIHDGTSGESALKSPTRVKFALHHSNTDHERIWLVDD